ncbi:unnamed protein product [Musa textilis]
MGAEENVRCPAFLAKPFVAPSSSAAPAMPFTPSSSADKKSVHVSHLNYGEKLGDDVAGRLYGSINQ